MPTPILNLMVLLIVCQSICLAKEASTGADATRHIQGTVVDHQGKPVADARLWYPYAFDKNEGKRLEATTQANAQGQFRLKVPAVPDGNGLVASNAADLWAWAPKYNLGSGSKSVRVEEDQRIELAPATDTSLVVLDPEGNPVAGVLIEPQHYRSRLGYSLVPNGAIPLVSGRTDAEGRIMLPALARDRFYQVKLTSDEFGIQTQRLELNRSEPAERTIQLRPVSRIEGRVVADHLAWCGGIKLYFTTEKRWEAGEKQRPPWPTEGQASATTDKSGRFVVPIIAQGRLNMVQTIIDENLHARPKLPRMVDLQAGQTATLEISMQRMVKIRGTIIAQDTRQPLEGVKIHVYFGTFRQGTDVVSDANGQFSAYVLPGRVRFQPMNLARTKYLQLGSPEPQEVPDDAEDFELSAVEVVPTKPINGRLVDQDDAPVAEARVYAFYKNWLCSTAKTNEDGAFTLPKLPLSIDADQASYRVQLDVHVTRNMGDGGVQIESGEPLSIRVRR